MNPLAALLAGPPGSGTAGSPTAGQAQSPQTGLFAVLLGANGELTLNAQTTLDHPGTTDLAGLLAAQQSEEGDPLALATGLEGEVADAQTAPLLADIEGTIEGLDPLAPAIGPLTTPTQTEDGTPVEAAVDPDQPLVDTAPEPIAAAEEQDGDTPVPAASPAPAVTMTQGPATSGDPVPAAAPVPTQDADVAKQTPAPTQQPQTAKAAPNPAVPGQPTPAPQNGPAPQAGQAPQQAPAAPAGDGADATPAPATGEPRRAELAQSRPVLPENNARGRTNLARTVETLAVVSNPAGGQSLVQVVERDTGGGKGVIALDPAVSSLQMRAGPATPTPGAAQAPQVPLNTLAVHIAQQAQNGNRRFDIRLDPPELGRLEIRLDVTRDGQVTTHMVVERAETLDLLQRDSRALERALQNAGLDTSEGGLKFSLKGQGQGQAQDTGPDGKPRGDGSTAENNGDGDAAADDADVIGEGRHYVASDGLDIRI